ncbi:TetR/AcrR family transcriptional regulator [Bacillus paralicheniformis]|uniref:TetR/AcrR family transcriptional regulator n=1 Tax=Bacillus paralicheniformis TaxID=1648923 RepID=UPI000D03AB06|nr:TetR/AcrR family transcriptional regulator [Bacillus paralicheniformis]MBR8662236.1 TetR family transcriptional regulator [Bacillus paralicheniformis]MDW6055628.1 TetR/AcrR family transcriptional regulator [Bacillus paralicheniformis]MED1066933.1 TetR/AcrR family transcriptional regulator [Bacillus paralicheniformis]MED1218216.1 TetR/AcrR family transcriptional regulator [Bacillus paralicheniformis]PRS12058.1 TetR family transcriptional regulator [Bacillus paralicheniformis]
MKNSSEALTKEQILAATEDTLRRFGVAKTSITDVAKALDVSHGTIYRHFKNKKEIFEAATEKWLNEKIMQPLADVYHDTSCTGASHVKAYIEKLFELKRYYARKDEELFEMYAKVTNECTELVDKSIDQIIGQLSELIAVCPANSNDSEELARSIFYATERFHHPAHANEWKRETIEQEFNIVWNLIEKGFLK